MAKAGIEMLVRYTAEELAGKGIRVNAVQPGIIDDELMAFITAGGALFDDYVAQTPLGRPGTVEDVAEAVRYLAGPESAWVTGTCLAVDGGHHLRHGANYGLLFESCSHARRPRLAAPHALCRHGPRCDDVRSRGGCPMTEATPDIDLLGGAFYAGDPYPAFA